MPNKNDKWRGVHIFQIIFYASTIFVFVFFLGNFINYQKILDLLNGKEKSRSDPSRGVLALGGGFPAPTGFALWQVQIYSNQIYSKDQIEEDKVLGAAGKSLWLQEPFQRYHRCAGSLIRPNVVLTAAHCVAKPPVDGVKVSTHARFWSAHKIYGLVAQHIRSRRLLYTQDTNPTAKRMTLRLFGLYQNLKR